MTTSNTVLDLIEAFRRSKTMFAAVELGVVSEIDEAHPALADHPQELVATDVLADVYEIERPIAPKLAEFEKYLHEKLDSVEVAKEAAATVAALSLF